MSFDAVIFDLFGTLLQNYLSEDYPRIQERIARTLGLEAEDFRRVWRQTNRERDAGRFGSTEGDLENACRLLGVRPTPEQTTEAARLRTNVYGSNLRLRADAADTLRRIRDIGLRIGLISDCGWEIVAVWHTLPVAQLIDQTVFSCREGITKPDSTIYLTACRRLGVAPERCLYVGDGGSSELTGARAVGMTPVLIRTDAWPGFERPDADGWTGPEITELSQVLDIISSAPVKDR